MKLNVAVVFGGISVEHDISIITGVQTLNAVDKRVYNVIPVYIDKVGEWYYSPDFFDVKIFSDGFKKLKSIKKVAFCGDKFLYIKGKNKLRKWQQVDCILLCTHGGNGENGALQGFLEVVGVPYTSCSVFSSAACMDKVAMKNILKQAQIPVIEGCVVKEKDFEFSQAASIKEVENKLRYPVIVKPANLGSSIGISVCKNKTQLVRALKNAFQFDKKILVEKFIENMKEVNVSVFVSEDEFRFSQLESPKGKNKFLSFDDKYISQQNKSTGMVNCGRELPAKVGFEVKKQILKIAKTACEELDCRGVVRIDFIIETETGKIYINEINTIPGSLAFYLWEDSFSFDLLLDKLIQSAILGVKKEKQKIKSFASSVLSRQAHQKLSPKLKV